LINKRFMEKPPFEPPKLPPKIDYAKLVTEIARAHASIGKLNGLLSQIPNPALLGRTLVTREAVMSSQIEGTEATLSEVLEQEAMGEAKEETPKEKDYREIMNYRRALRRGIDVLADRPLTENVIKELHGVLLDSARGHHRSPGEFRRKLVFIGKPGATREEASYVPPLPDRIPELFSDLERYMHAEERDALVQIGIVHYQFEAIHPFEDGNGRIGRLLISLMLHQKGILAHPFIYLSEFFEEHRKDYYDLLRDVSEQGNWEAWLAFFLRGLDVQAQRAQEVCGQMVELHARLERQMPEMNSKYANAFLDALFANPYVTSRNMRERTGIRNVQTLYALIGKFTEKGIISDMTPNRRRNKIYRFDGLLRLIGQ
jgi:Fic family protein